MCRRNYWEVPITAGEWPGSLARAMLARRQALIATLATGCLRLASPQTIATRRLATASRLTEKGAAAP